MPDLSQPDPIAALGLWVDADLHVSFNGERGDASAHLHGSSDGLVLDVDQPAVLLSEARRQQLPLLAVRQFIADTPVSVRTQGRKLASVRLSPAGKLRMRPTLLGIRTVLQIALSSPRGRALGLLGAAGLATALVSSRRR